jgi:hypothetical protein
MFQLMWYILVVYSADSPSQKLSRHRQHTSAYVSIRQHTSAYVSIRQHICSYIFSCVAPGIRYVYNMRIIKRIRQHTSAYVSIRQHTSAYVSIKALEASDMRIVYRGGALTKYGYTYNLFEILFLLVVTSPGLPKKNIAACSENVGTVE